MPESDWATIWGRTVDAFVALPDPVIVAVVTVLGASIVALIGAVVARRPYRRLTALVEAESKADGRSKAMIDAKIQQHLDGDADMLKRLCLALGLCALALSFTDSEGAFFAGIATATIGVISWRSIGVVAERKGWGFDPAPPSTTVKRAESESPEWWNRSSND